MNVSDLELVCLEIMANGENMLAIGSWEAPIMALVEKGYAQKIGNGYRITKAGEAAAVGETDEPKGKRFMLIDGEMTEISGELPAP